MDLQYRLPPFQQILFTPTIILSLVLLGLVIIVVVLLSNRSRTRSKREARREALRMVEKILLKRGGNQEDVDRILAAFRVNPRLDPATMVMVRDKFHDYLLPVLTKMYDKNFAERMERIYFPPPKDTRRSFIRQSGKDAHTAVEEQKAHMSSQATAAILDLMDATLRPGILTRLTFEGVDGGFECLVMGHDMHSINLTIPAHNDSLVASLRPGTGVEGTLEDGPSLMAFTATVIGAVAGSMPYCRISPWTSAWVVRKRESVRLPISLEIDFQHISTSSAGSIKMSTLHKELGTIRPGRLIDVSLGGCCIETPSKGIFQVGDMIRFSKSLVTGNPPATLLGALVRVDDIDPASHNGACQRLHVQFLVIDDVSQRILVRTMRQLQELNEREEWMGAQQLLQKMRRHKVQNIGSPAPAPRPPRDSTRVEDPMKPGTGSPKPGPQTSRRSSTRSLPKPGTRHMPRAAAPGQGGAPTKILPRPTAGSERSARSPVRPSTRSLPRPPAPPPASGTGQPSISGRNPNQSSRRQK